MATALGIKPERLKLIDEAQYHLGLSDEIMLLMAQASDCLIQPSRREGACLPLLEYQACGIPVIASDAHAQKEYNKGRWRVDGHRAWSVLGAWEFAPSVDSIAERIIEVAEAKKDDVLGLLQRGLVIDNHSIEAVALNHLQPILEAIAMDILSRE
jgi:glycosyltransferase involved in cell wall biosynthesis